MINVYCRNPDGTLFKATADHDPLTVNVPHLCEQMKSIYKQQHIQTLKTAVMVVIK